MKTLITYIIRRNNLNLVIVFFTCLLFSLNSFSQKIQTSLTETWKNENWENTNKTSSTYDGNGFLIYSLSQIWEINSWKDNTQSFYTNNLDGSASQMISQLWNSETNVWENTLKVNYTYNAAKKILTSESEFWMGTDWMPIVKQTNTYDNNGLLTNILSQNWDFISSWNNVSQSIYTNKDKGIVSQIITQLWNLNVWTNSTRITFSYTASDKVETSITEKWSVANWINFSLDTNSYNGSGFLINSLSQDWIKNTNEWKNSSQYNYTYNSENGNPMQIISQTWDEIGSLWNNDSRTTLTYAPLGITVPVFENSIVAYPNPAQEVIMIETNGYEQNLAYYIIDQTGRQFMNGILIKNKNLLEINQLASGLYFIQIGQNKKTIKMIKK